nr:PREDICTED: uncharacterized protein LOC106705881 isoform X2 [Latimeria chalumnae]|eukprot:XP_014351447.1 PREDICTED: uncharacterized protein LOC106705881 isoform X2 [Latimeria chalumnae]
MDPKGRNEVSSFDGITTEFVEEKMVGQQSLYTSEESAIVISSQDTDTKSYTLRDCESDSYNLTNAMSGSMCSWKGNEETMTATSIKVSSERISHAVGKMYTLLGESSHNSGSAYSGIFHLYEINGEQSLSPILHSSKSIDVQGCSAPVSLSGFPSRLDSEPEIQAPSIKDTGKSLKEVSVKTLNKQSENSRCFKEKTLETKDKDTISQTFIGLIENEINRYAQNRACEQRTFDWVMAHVSEEEKDLKTFQQVTHEPNVVQGATGIKVQKNKESSDLISIGDLESLLNDIEQTLFKERSEGSSLDISSIETSDSLCKISEDSLSLCCKDKENETSEFLGKALEMTPPFVLNNIVSHANANSEEQLEDKTFKHYKTGKEKNINKPSASCTITHTSDYKKEQLHSSSTKEQKRQSTGDMQLMEKSRDIVTDCLLNTDSVKEKITKNMPLRQSEQAAVNVLLWTEGLTSNIGTREESLPEECDAADDTAPDTSFSCLNIFRLHNRKNLFNLNLNKLSKRREHSQDPKIKASIFSKFQNFKRWVLQRPYRVVPFLSGDI